jgi:hypothetical protein
MKTIRILAIALLFIISIIACDNSRNNAKLRNSTDTTSVNKAGGPAITDTATITQQKKDSLNHTSDTAANGNVKPSGRP